MIFLYISFKCCWWEVTPWNTCTAYRNLQYIKLILFVFKIMNKHVGNEVNWVKCRAKQGKKYHRMKIFFLTDLGGLTPGTPVLGSVPVLIYACSKSCKRTALFEFYFVVYFVKLFFSLGFCNQDVFKLLYTVP